MRKLGVGEEHLSEPCSPTAAGAPQECCVPRRGQGQDERGGANGPHAAAPERLYEGETEEPAAPGQSGPRPRYPACLQSGKVLPATRRRGPAPANTAYPQPVPGLDWGS